ncbi:hypothetical protein AGABI2DRAFT_137760 [Agaricus bisporus var. bisporus H97]|uniref:hypothetical protein n=1 Tax=Agaricus bisporus var. bisporus (strain H97 / ATCC MYA-4626 / FGSC 10389) TaxID=936046 RepID=UPI00029F654A|nr:hypothetical protein AGABI2DRAFT_137760 [Agaricus bisporus var. bisporus H97]EKV45203.1 hypothetical protein AGABI2DRAFT_137760 [Agaricus bisporus var. bisporus H97]
MFRLKFPLIPSLVPRSTAEREDVYNVDDRTEQVPAAAVRGCGSVAKDDAQPEQADKPSPTA